MSHFEVGQWADWVRGLAGEKQRAEMEAHLSSGCGKCRRTMETMKRLAAIAQDEAAYQPPDYAVHNAKAIYALQEPETVWILPRIVARLVYDSFREPLPAGLRSRHQLTRHALYEADDYSLDLRLEHQHGSARVTLVGQIADRANPKQSLANLPVILLSDKTIVGRTSSNAFGEFQIEYNPKNRLHLYIQSAEKLDARIEVPLPGLGHARVPTKRRPPKS